MTAALLFIALLTSFCADLVEGQTLTRTWVSGVGDDGNVCSRTLPCKTWAGAISRTQPGGAISVLDPGGFSPIGSSFTITRGVLIDGGGFPASAIPTYTNGIVVDVASNETVVLTNMQIIGAGTGLAGIKVLGGTVFIDNVIITGVQQGILISPTSLDKPTKVYVSNSRIQSSRVAGLQIGKGGDGQANLQVTLDRVTIQQGTNGVVMHTGFLTLSNSVIGQNEANGVMISTNGSTAELNLLKNEILNNRGVGLQVGAGATVRVWDSQFLGNTMDIDCATELVAYSDLLLSGGTEAQLPSSCMKTNTTSTTTRSDASDASPLRTSVFITWLLNLLTE